MDDGNLKALLLPCPADQMRMWEISPRVNSPKNDDPSLWEPLHAEPTQRTTDALELFARVIKAKARKASPVSRQRSLQPEM